MGLTIAIEWSMCCRTSSIFDAVANARGTRCGGGAESEKIWKGWKAKSESEGAHGCEARTEDKRQSTNAR